MSNNKNDELIPIEQVLADMYDPDGGIKSMAAEDYYYRHYATDEERAAHDKIVKITNIVLRVVGVLLIVYLIAEIINL